MADQTIDQARLDLANDCSYEIGILAQMLNKYVDENDACGEIRPAARGVLLRIGKLTDIVCGAITPTGDRWDPLEELRQALQRN